MTRTWCAVDVLVPVGENTIECTALAVEAFSIRLVDVPDTMWALRGYAQLGQTIVCSHAPRAIRALWWPAGEDVTIREFDGRFSVGVWRYDRRRKPVEIWDIRAVLGMSNIAELVQLMGGQAYPEPSLLAGADTDRYLWVCEKHAVWECLECYAVERVKAMHQALTSLGETLAGWGTELHRSAAATAVAAWRALDHPEPRRSHNPKVDRLARAAYLGGRVEAYKLGHMGPAYLADMRSAYGWAELSVPMPDPEQMTYATHVGVNGSWINYEGVARARVRVPATYVPPLPVTQHGIRSYPVGELVGCWMIHELRHAVQYGTELLEVECVAFARETTHPFPQFAGVMWALREEFGESDPIKAMLGRTLLRHLSGRLATRATAELQIYRPLRTLRRGNELEGSNWVVREERVYAERVSDCTIPDPHRCVLWAAQITAAVRVRLHQMMLDQGTQLVGCDTDSVISLAPIVGLSEGLGGWADKGRRRALVVHGPGAIEEQLEDGTWRGKVRGVRPDQALEHLRQGWASTARRAFPHNLVRTPTQPELLSSGLGWSDTLPPVSAIFGE